MLAVNIMQVASIFNLKMYVAKPFWLDTDIAYSVGERFGSAYFVVSLIINYKWFFHTDKL